MKLTPSLVVLSVTVAGEQEDYVAFSEEICLDWDYLHFSVCVYTSLHYMVKLTCQKETVTITRGRTPDSSVMTTRAGMYH
jgi:hypothetical protein